MGTIFFCAVRVFPLSCVNVPAAAQPRTARKNASRRDKEFSKKIIPVSVCLCIDSGSRDRDSGTRPDRHRQRKHDRQTANGIPRQRAKRKERLHGKYFHVQHPLLRAGKNSKRREVTAQREREGLRLTLKLSQAGCGYYPERSLRTMGYHSVTYAVYYSAVRQILEAHCMDLCPCGCSPLMVRSLWNGMANGRSWKMDRMS